MKSIRKIRQTVWLLLLFLITAALPMQAKTVSQSEALKVAQKFFNSGIKTRAGSSELKFSWDSHSIVQTKSQNDEAPSFYVFSAEKGEGFVMVSADDAVAPILAYSFENSAPNRADMPGNIRDWLEWIDFSIREIKSSSQIASLAVQNLWANTKAGDDEILLETAKWNQGEPYNLECPIDGAERSVTGCTATALSIVMHYYQWPKKGTGITEAYTTKEGLNVPARNLEHDYDWSNMLMEYKKGQYSNVESKAVSELMADIGHAIQANYSSKETSAAYRIKELYEKFDYSASMYIVDESNYPKEQWADFIREELEKKRPVLLAGSNKYRQSGHAFVVDGMSGFYFHINWGWGGNGNGYFLLDGLCPDSMSDYSFYKSFVLNFVPDTGEEPENILRIYEADGFKASTDDFINNRYFTVDFKVLNTSVIDFNGAIRIAVTNKDGEIKEWVSKEIERELESHYWVLYRNVACVINCEIVYGDRLRMFYRLENQNDWYLILPNNTAEVWEIPLTDEESIEDHTSVSFNKEQNVLEVSYENNVTCTLLLNGTVVTEGVSFKTGKMTVNTNQLPEGTYLVRLQKKGFNDKEFTFTIKPL